MNKAILTGNLTKDPELRTTTSGTSVCTFTVAVQRRYKGTDGKPPVDYLNIVVWRQLGELCGKYLSKGRKVLIEGEIQNRSYEDKDGNKRYMTGLYVEVGTDDPVLPPTPDPLANPFADLEDDLPKDEPKGKKP